MERKNKMESQLVTNNIEIRSSNVNNNPKYIVNGTAIVAGKKYPREWVVDRTGKTIKVSKEMFTPHFIQSLKEQAKRKNIFVDTQHELVRDAGINTILKGKLSKDDEERLTTMMSKKMLPLAKVSDMDIEGDSLKVYTELNPMFPTVDDFHKRVFDATWYSLENGFLNGISLNFDNWKFTEDANGDVVVDDADLLGVSYVSGASSHLHSIDEVALRQFEKVIQTREGEMKMEEEMEKLKAEKARIETERLQVEKEKQELQEIKKKVEMERQIEEQNKIKKELEEKSEALKKVEEEKNKLRTELDARGVARQIPPPNQPSGRNVGTPQFYEENINKIMESHNDSMKVLQSGKHPMIDNSMRGFSELVNLQAKVSPTAGFSKKDADYIEENRLLGRENADIIVPRARG